MHLFRYLLITIKIYMIKISSKQIVIGTAQFDDKYGLFKSKISKDSKNYFLDEINNLNFAGIDGAESYKNSHMYLGNWLKKNKHSLKLYSKITATEDVQELNKKLRDIIKKLNYNKLDGMLIHNSSNFSKKKQVLISEQILKNHYIKKAGLSIYKADELIIDPAINIIQIPANIFNLNNLRSKKTLKFIENKGELIVRSVFSQGLLLANYQKIPKLLLPLKPALKKFNQISNEAKVHPISLAASSIIYVLPNCKLVLGANNVLQLKQILKYISSPINEDLICYAIKECSKYSNKLWDPRNWKIDL